MNFERWPNLEISVSFLRQISLRSHTRFYLLKPSQSNFSGFNWFKLLRNLHWLIELNSEKSSGIKALNDRFRNELLDFLRDKGRGEFYHIFIFQQVNFLKLDHFLLIRKYLIYGLLSQIVNSLIVCHLNFIKCQLFSLISELRVVLKANSLDQRKLNVVKFGKRRTWVVVCESNDNIFDGRLKFISRTFFNRQH